MEPIEDISTLYSNVKECVSINCVGEVIESMDKTLSDSHIKKEYEKMKPHEKRMFNQWVRFHHDYQQKHGVAGMSRQLMNLQVTTQCPPMDPVIPAIEMATAEASESGRDSRRERSEMHSASEDKRTRSCLCCYYHGS